MYIGGAVLVCDEDCCISQSGCLEESTSGFGVEFSCGFLTTNLYVMGLL
jgi:hypothetical protein